MRSAVGYSDELTPREPLRFSHKAPAVATRVVWGSAVCGAAAISGRVGHLESIGSQGAWRPSLGRGKGGEGAPRSWVLDLDERRSCAAWLLQFAVEGPLSSSTMPLSHAHALARRRF